MVIQIRQFMVEDDEKNILELAKVIEFLDAENIDYDLEPPKRFKQWLKVRNKTFLIGEDL